VQGTLRAWVAAAWHFYPLPDLLARLRHIRIVGVPSSILTRPARPGSCA